MLFSICNDSTQRFSIQCTFGCTCTEWFFKVAIQKITTFQSKFEKGKKLMKTKLNNVTVKGKYLITEKFEKMLEKGFGEGSRVAWVDHKINAPYITVKMENSFGENMGTLIIDKLDENLMKIVETFDIHSFDGKLYSDKQYIEIIRGIDSDIDVSVYASQEVDSKTMRDFRENLEYQEKLEIARDIAKNLKARKNEFDWDVVWYESSDIIRRIILNVENVDKIKDWETYVRQEPSFEYEDAVDMTEENIITVYTKYGDIYVYIYVHDDNTVNINAI